MAAVSLSVKLGFKNYPKWLKELPGYSELLCEKSHCSLYSIKIIVHPLIFFFLLDYERGQGGEKKPLQLDWIRQ